MSQRTLRRTVRRAGPALQPVDTQCHISRAQRPKPEFGHRGPEQRDERRPHRSRQMQRGAVIGNQHACPSDQCCRLPQRQLAARIDGLTARRPDGRNDLLPHFDVVRPAHRNNRDLLGEPRGQRRIVPPALTAPDRAGRQGNKRFGNQRCCHLCVRRRWLQEGRIDARRLVREGQEPVTFVPESRLGASVCIEEGPPARKPDPGGYAGKDAQCCTP